jgi:hypothetical protein
LPMSRARIAAKRAWNVNAAAIYSGAYQPIVK